MGALKFHAYFQQQIEKSMKSQNMIMEKMRFYRHKNDLFSKLILWFLWPLGIAIVNWVSNEALNLSFTTPHKLQVIPTKYNFEVPTPFTNLSCNYSLIEIFLSICAKVIFTHCYTWQSFDTWLLNFIKKCDENNNFIQLLAY